MLCCLLGALLAGNIVGAWRFAASAARYGAPVWAGRAMLGCVAAAALVAASATLAAHASVDASGSLAGDPPCAGARPADG